MVRRAAAPLALLVLFAAVSAGAPAQALQRLAVTSFALSTDTASPAIDVPFHLVLRLRVRQHVARIENLDLPILAELELLGDVRETVSNAGGTEYRETITSSRTLGNRRGRPGNASGGRRARRQGEGMVYELTTLRV